MSAAMVVVSGAMAVLFAQAGPATATLFEGARLIDGNGGPPVEDSAFLVERNQITRVGRRGQVTAPSSAVRVDLSGKTVMPAIVDAHSHLGYDSFLNPSDPQRYTRANVIDHLRRSAYWGIAVVMSMGVDRGEVPFEIRASPIPGAALLRTAGRGIAMPRGGPPASYRIDAPYGIRTEAEGRRAVQDMAARKVDLVKIWVDDRNGTVEKLPPALYHPIIDEAHTLGQRVIAHVYTLEDAKALLRANLDGFAHGVRDKDIDDEFLQMMRQRPNVFLTPNMPESGVPEDLAWTSGTVAAAEIQQMTEAQDRREPGALKQARDFHQIQARSLAKLNAAGVRIALGTDGIGQGWTTHTEMADMVAAGMTPGQVIVAATRTAANVLGVTDHGTVAAGKAASFVVLDANPLDTITNTRRISRVYLRGQEIDRASLSRSLTARGTN
jgi:imidazolonepropionase-like amidohydrolase